MNNFIFPHTSIYEIPVLDINKQGDFINYPISGWGSVSRRTRFRGTWHFYIDDSKFTALWKHPETILKTKAIYAVEPNFSTHEQMQLPVALYRIYQKRYLARYWQEHDIGIFVDLNVADHYQQLNLHGVPTGWSSYATHATDSRLDDLKEHAKIARTHAGGEIKLLVYGGGKKTARWCEEHNFTHVRDARNEVRNG